MHDSNDAIVFSEFDNRSQVSFVSVTNVFLLGYYVLL